jgi:hypothetical protein
MDWVAWVTFALAVIGACLGVLNTWHTFDQRKVRLKVRPLRAIPLGKGAAQRSPRGSDGGLFSIEVINLGTFAVTIDEFGFAVGSGRHAAITAPKFLDNEGLPRRLEPREAATAYFSAADILAHIRREGHRLGKAYVRTACDVRAYGASPALRQLQREAGSTIPAGAVAS